MRIWLWSGIGFELCEQQVRVRTCADPGRIFAEQGLMSGCYAGVQERGYRIIRIYGKVREYAMSKKLAG